MHKLCNLRERGFAGGHIAYEEVLSIYHVFVRGICNRGAMVDSTSRQNPTDSDHNPQRRTPNAPYRRTVPHVSQSPITDENYTRMPHAQDESQQTGQHTTTPGRKHMGVATADPQYLPQSGPAHPRRSNPGDTGQRQRLHYERYLQTPGSKKSIFVARQERARRHAIVVAIIALVLVALVLWLILFR